MPEMKITFAEEGKPEYVVTVPAATVTAADDYAVSVGKAGAVHLMTRFLLDNLLAGAVLPRTSLPTEVQEKVDLLQSDLAEKIAEIETERLKTFLPVLEIDGNVVTLPQIEAQLAAAKEAALESEETK